LARPQLAPLLTLGLAPLLTLGLAPLLTLGGRSQAVARALAQVLVQAKANSQLLMMLLQAPRHSRAAR